MDIRINTTTKILGSKVIALLPMHQMYAHTYAHIHINKQIKKQTHTRPHTCTSHTDINTSTHEHTQVRHPHTHISTRHTLQTDTQTHIAIWTSFSNRPFHLPAHTHIHTFTMKKQIQISIVHARV